MIFGRTWIQYLDSNYECNQLGEVRNRKTKQEIEGQRHYKGELRIKIGKKNVRIHIMVCTCFKRRIAGHNLVNHIYPDKANCHANNVEWSTPAKNTKHAVDHGLIDMKRVRSFRTKKAPHC